MARTFFALESVVGVDFFNNNNNDFSQFSQELESVDSRVNRSFETLITERNVNDDNSLYSHVFKEIKNKLFNLNEIPDIPKLTDEQKSSFNDKYFSSALSNNINRVKKLVVNFYNKKIELEITIEQNKNRYETFCKNITDSIKSIDSIITIETEQDTALKESLNDRINWYYSELKLDALKKEYSDILLEYSYIKGILTEISSVMPTGICSICLENQVTYFIDPCGHTICTNCKDKSKNLSVCHFCRSNIIVFKRLYL